jgi:hypothetical protein
MRRLASLKISMAAFDLRGYFGAMGQLLPDIQSLPPGQEHQ